VWNRGILDLSFSSQERHTLFIEIDEFVTLIFLHQGKDTFLAIITTPFWERLVSMSPRGRHQANELVCAFLLATLPLLDIAFITTSGKSFLLIKDQYLLFYVKIIVFYQQRDQDNKPV
jgi:hypothetical protein